MSTQTMNAQTFPFLLDPLLKFIEVWESFRSKPYLCQAGKPTIGIGMTYYYNGRRVTLKDPPMSYSAAIAEKRLILIRDFLTPVIAASPSLLSEAYKGNPNRLFAVVSFAYNLGVPAYEASTLRRKIDAGDWDGAALEFPKWNKYTDPATKQRKVSNGLVNRRRAEKALFEKAP
jgi:lysozyme